MATRCQDTGEQLARGMAQLIDRIEALSGGAMSGSANTALQNASAQLNQGLTTILNALNGLAGKISNASTQLGHHDEDAASEIRAAAETTGNSSVVNILTSGR
jgi:uncharacterized protein YukE